MPMTELPFGAYRNLIDIFGKETLSKFRVEYNNNCEGLANAIKDIMNANGYMAEIITFKNGNAFLDGGIKVSGKIYTHHAIVLMGEWIIDALHIDDVIKTKDYIENLQKDNDKLRIDYTLSTGWYDENGMPYQATIDDLKNYKLNI